MNPNNEQNKERIEGKGKRASQAFSFSSLAIWDNMNRKEKQITIGAVVALVVLSIFLIYFVNKSDDPYEIISRGEEASDEESVSLEESEQDVVSINIKEASSEQSLGETELPGLNESQESQESSESSSTVNNPPHQVQILVQEGSLQEVDTSVIIGSRPQVSEQEPEEPVSEAPVSSEEPPEETSEPVSSEEPPEETSESTDTGSESGSGGEGSEAPGSEEGSEGDPVSSEETSESGEPSKTTEPGEETSQETTEESTGETGETSEEPPVETSEVATSEEISDSTEVSESEPVESSESVSEPVVSVDSTLAIETARIPTYQQQTLGSNPVYFYDHPVLDLGFDLREDHAMARDMYVLPTTNGFYILQRQMIQLENLSLDGLINKIETQGIEGATSVQVVSADQRDPIQAANPNTIFLDYKDNQIIAIQQVPVENQYISQIFANFADQVVDVNFIAEHVTTVPLEENNYEIVDTTEYLAQWKNLLDQYEVNPAQAEWSKNLPFYANSSGYVVDGEDRRSVVLTDNPSYSFMMVDLTGDGMMEYVVNAKTPNADNAQGYWAIFSTASNGLLLSAESFYGNGDLIQTGGDLVTTSELDSSTGITISFDYFRLPKQQATAQHIEFKEPEGFMSTMTGSEIAEEFPGHYIVNEGAEYYLVDRAAYDSTISDFISSVEGATILRGVNSTDMKSSLAQYEAALQDPESQEAGQTTQLGLSTELIEDPVAYLAATFTKVPFNRNIWEAAVPVEDLQDVEEPITVDYFE